MKKKGLESRLRMEEKRTVIWFLVLFYLISIGYDSFYYYIFPKYFTNSKIGFENEIGYVIYLILFAMIPLSCYLIKNGKQEQVKYVFFIVYTMLMIVSDLFTYIGTKQHYTSGNAVEVFFILFSPIFVNRRYYWLVFSGLIFKYLIIGVLLRATEVLFAIVLVLVLAIIAYIFLDRFSGYVQAIEDSFDKQLQGIVKGVIATLELKDPYTRGHSERVAFYALAMAREYGKFTTEELKEFNYACLLHDIGKINIPDSILMKPERLTRDEYEVIKTHPTVGAKAVRGVEGLKNGILIIQHHHERWDGTGYPEHLSGEQIPLLARITSIADAFDAMTSSRSYREAMPLSVAYQKIIEGRGTQFDPTLVETFIKVFPKWEEFHRSYPWLRA